MHYETELIKIIETNPDQRVVEKVADLLRSGGIAILPTDSVYALVCDMNNTKGIQQICKLLNKRFNRANLSMLCQNLSNLSRYSTPITTSTYKLMNRLLPGPFTFILKASSEVPKIFRSNRKTIGIRVPDNLFLQRVIETMGNPLVSSSIHAEDEIVEYLTDPNEIYQEWQHKVPLIIAGGNGSNIPSTVLDATQDQVELIREGLGMDQVQLIN